MNNKIRKITLAGLFMAINIIFTRFMVWDLAVGGLSILRVSFGPVPIYLSSILLGPIYGTIVGMVADFLGYLVKPIGPYFFGFTINAGITGLIPGLLVKFPKKNEPWWKLSGIVILVEIITSIILTPLWLSMMTGRAFVVLLLPNLLSRVILIPLYIVFIKVTLNYSRRTIPSLG